MYSDTVTASEQICDTKLELPIEAEVLIPDYLPQVFKIVKCFVYPVVLQKQVSAARLALEGYLRLVVFYQSDGADAALCRTEQKMPFTKQVELRPGDYFCAEVQLGGETEYVNCRAVNQRRVDIRGAYALSVSVTAQTSGTILTAVAEGGAEQKTVQMTGIRTIAVQEKPVTLQDAISFDTEPAAILDVTCIGTVNEAKLISGKAVLKGEMIARVTYRDGEGALRHLVKEIPFNEILEVEGAGEDCACLAFARSEGCTVTTAEDGTTSLSINAALQAKVYRPCEAYAVSDAFSTLCETELAYGEVFMEQPVMEIAREAEAVASGAMPDAAAEIVAVFATALQPELLEQNGTAQIRGRVLVHMLCKNELGEIDCYDKACEYLLPDTCEAPHGELLLTARADVLDASARRTGEDASVAVLVRVRGMLTRRRGYPVLTQIVAAQEREPAQDGVALRIYYAEQGEPVFDIARRYAVPTAQIMTLNALAQDTVPERMQLVIPAVRV